MRLETINRVLGRLGLVLVVVIGDAGEPTVFRLIRTTRYPLR